MSPTVRITRRSAIAALVGSAGALLSDGRGAAVVPLGAGRSGVEGTPQAVGLPMVLSALFPGRPLRTREGHGNPLRGAAGRARLAHREKAWPHLRHAQWPRRY